MTHRKDRFEIGDRVRKDSEFCSQWSKQMPEESEVVSIKSVPRSERNSVGHCQHIFLFGYGLVSGAYYRKVEG